MYELLNIDIILIMLKQSFKLFIFVFIYFFNVLIFAHSTENGTAVFTGEDYSVYVTYTKNIQPGDAICVKLNFTPSKKTSREPTSQTQAVILFSDVRKTDCYTVKTTKQRGGNAALSLLGMIPVSTWQKAGDYEITIMYSAYGRDFMKFNLPISIQKKDFISETVDLDDSNTAIKTDSSPKRMLQIDRLNNILFTTNSDSIYQNKPFTVPTKETRLTAFFGDRRVYAYSNGKTSTSLHHGIDYGIPTGTPVYACGTGKVVMAENRISTGWTVVIEHMPGLYSLYYHLDSYSVEEGQMITQEDQIGFSGSTGLATGPHLHWEVRLNGESVSPDFFTENFAFFN